MLSSDFHNVLSCLKSLFFQWPLEFGKRPEVAGRVRSLANLRSLANHRNLVFLPKGLNQVRGMLFFRNFPYNENPTRTINTTSFKCYLPSTDSIDRRKNSRMSMKVQGLLKEARFIEIHQVFPKKKTV